MYSLKLTIKSLQNLKKMEIRYRYLLKIIYLLRKKSIMLLSNNVPYKKKNTIYTVLRSPHVYKKSMEHFNYNYYKQTFYLVGLHYHEIMHILIIFKKILPQNLLLKIQLQKN